MQSEWYVILAARDAVAVNNARQVQRMDMEARSSSGDGAREMLTKIKEYRADIGKLKDEARALSSNAAAAADRAELGLGDDYLTTSAGQRDRLLKTTDRMQITSDRIKQGRAQLLETEVRLLLCM